MLGLTGGIAAYKAAELCRLLVKDGFDVRVVMTEAACRFITPGHHAGAVGQARATDLWDEAVANAMGHIELSRDRELIVVAPASADFIAKLAGGLADDLLSTLCLARECPLLVAPGHEPADVGEPRDPTQHRSLAGGRRAHCRAGQR